MSNENKSGVVRAKDSKSNFGKHGWLIIIFGMAMYFCSAGVIVEGSNMIYPAYATASGISEAALYSFATIASLAGIPLSFAVGILLTKIGPTKVMSICWIGGAVGLVLTGLTSNAIVYIIGRILIATASAGGITMAYNTLIANWYPTKKDLVQGYATIGSNLATAFAVMILTVLISAFSIRTTFFILAVVFFIIGVIAVAGFKDNPEDAGCFPDNDQNMTREKAMAMLEEGEHYKQTSPWTVSRLLKTKQVWQIAIGYGIILMITVGMLSTLVTTLIIKGLNTTTAVSMMTVAAIVAIPCSYLWGYLGSKKGTKSASLLLYVVVIICLVSMLLPGTWTAVITVALLGCFIGAGNNLTPSIIGSIFGRYDFSRAMTVIIPIWNIVVAFATTIVGVPQSLTGSYTASYIVLIICAVIGFILVYTLDETCIGRSDLNG